jgi:hypothetical protein
MVARVGLAALLVGASLLGGCSTASSEHATDDAARAVPAGDPAYSLAQLRHRSSELGGAPTDLDGALPNHHYELGDSGKVSSYSDALVIGTVTGASKGNGVIWRDESDYTVVDFDDPSADTRTAVVTMTVDASTGANASDNGTVTFRVLVPSEADPTRFAEGLAGLGRVAVVLDRDPSKTDSTPWRPLMNDSLIGVVAEDGSLTLPGLARGRVFAGDIHTVDQLLAAARTPEKTTTVAVP